MYVSVARTYKSSQEITKEEDCVVCSVKSKNAITSLNHNKPIVNFGLSHKNKKSHFLPKAEADRYISDCCLDADRESMKITTTVVQRARQVFQKLIQVVFNLLVLLIQKIKNFKCMRCKSIILVVRNMAVAELCFSNAILALQSRVKGKLDGARHK